MVKISRRSPTWDVKNNVNRAGFQPSTVVFNDFFVELWGEMIHLYLENQWLEEDISCRDGLFPRGEPLVSGFFC